MSLKNTRNLCILMMVLIFLVLLNGCGGSNALMNENDLADEAWLAYTIDFNVFDSADGKIEGAYREGFHIGFTDAFSSPTVYVTSVEKEAYEIGYADGVWNRTGDY